jgi:hypothetical protein
MVQQPQHQANTDKATKSARAMQMETLPMKYMHFFHLRMYALTCSGLTSTDAGTMDLSCFSFMAGPRRCTLAVTVEAAEMVVRPSFLAASEGTAGAEVTLGRG